MQVKYSFLLLLSFSFFMHGINATLTSQQTAKLFKVLLNKKTRKLHTHSKQLQRNDDSTSDLNLRIQKMKIERDKKIQKVEQFFSVFQNKERVKRAKILTIHRYHNHNVSLLRSKSQTIKNNSND